MDQTIDLTLAYKAARMSWATEKLTHDHDWKCVVFSDEKKFNLDGPDGFEHYWRDLRRPALTCVRRQQGGGSVMAWGGMSWEVKTELAILVGKQASANYVYTLSEYLLPFAHLREFFQEMEVQVMEWPARSPDMNPIENLWASMTRPIDIELPFDTDMEAYPENSTTSDDGLEDLDMTAAISATDRSARHEPREFQLRHNARVVCTLGFHTPAKMKFNISPRRMMLATVTK
ncbi:hypothetical protein P43SY_008930 [Pythium insidiosum]|uniref:Tc1-like transposase DDE domain-containing protein n=1 Tax=Pythium insidiosum TaxID=114742 RepID=A0AAD5MAW3_PYTIN|nr:hypothetical protein P43SY_008930 [Pythium insidiosum]